jgi:ferredoxin
MIDTQDKHAVLDLLDAAIAAAASRNACLDQVEDRLAFSCKGRGPCPSCNVRRMAGTTAHPLDHVIPPLPVRPWGEE